MKLKRAVLLAWVLQATVLVSAPAVPSLISYQGQLNDKNGVPISGTVNFVFSLYSVTSGGTALWTEAQTVSVSSGIFNVQLGTVQPLPATVFLQETLYLGVKVGADAEMTPRQRLTSAAFSRHAEVADALVGGILPRNLLAGRLPDNQGFTAASLENLVDGSGLTAGVLARDACNVCSFYATYDIGVLRTADISISATISRWGGSDLGSATWSFLSSVDGINWEQIGTYPGTSGQTDKISRQWLRIRFRYFRISYGTQSWRGAGSSLSVDEIVAEEKQ